MAAQKSTLLNASMVVSTAMLTPIQKLDPFKKESEVAACARREFNKCVNSGNYSYDPLTGEIIVGFYDHVGLDMLQAVNKKLIGEIIREAFIEDGWESVVVLPRSSTNIRAMLKVRAKLLMADELFTQKSVRSK